MGATPSRPVDTPPQCLDEAAVQRVARGECPLAEATHAAGCGECGQRVEEAKREIEFLGRARGLLGEDLGPIGAPRLAGYRPLGVISTGAQGVVYRARQESTQRIVAIKVLAAGNSQRGESDGHGTASATRRRMRAEREVEIIARLRHPNIVAVHESRTIDDNPGAGGGGGRVALVMEYVDGVPIDQWQPDAAAAPTQTERLREVLRVFTAVCSGVHHAHLNGVIHRDLKPDNILVTHEGRPVVLDFGIAKLNAVQGLSTTATGDFAGTPAYASPEQVAAKPDEVDALTDVYSLGVILYRLVCGALPYDLGETIFEAARVIASVEPVPPRSRDALISKDLQAIILRALAKKPSSRYQSAAALGRDVGRFLAGEPVEARSESGWYLLAKAVAVNRARLGLIGAATVVLAGAGVTVWLSLSSAAASAQLAASRAADARKEHVRARAVDELMREALPVADPQRPDLSRLIGYRLGRLYYRLETGAFAGDPDVDQEIRRLWGRVYTGFGSKAATHIEYAEVSLRHGLVRLRTAHAGDDPEIASTLQQLADVLLVRRRYEEALTVANEALEMRRRLDGAAARSVAESYGLRARILLTQNDAGGADQDAARSMAILAALPPQGPDLLLASMQALAARVRLQRGDAQGAAPLALAALRQRLSILRADDADVLDALGLAGEVTAAAPGTELGAAFTAVWGEGGQPGSAGATAANALLKADLALLAAPDRGNYYTPVLSGRTDALGRMARFQRRVSDDDLALVGTLLLQIETAAAEVRYKVRAAAAEQAAEILSRRFGPNDFAVLVCVQDAAVTSVFGGDLEKAVELTGRSCAIWDSFPPSARDNLLAANSHRYRAWALDVAKNYPLAEREARTAIELFTAAAGARHHTIAACRAFLAYALAGQGKLADAERESEAALQHAIASPTSPPDLIGHVRFVRGHILSLQPGREAEARENLQAAWDIFMCNSLVEYPWQPLLIKDAATVSTRLGDADGAARWAAMKPTMRPLN